MFVHPKTAVELKVHGDTELSSIVACRFKIKLKKRLIAKSDFGFASFLGRFMGCAGTFRHIFRQNFVQILK